MILLQRLQKGLKENAKFYLPILLVGVLAWYPVLNFWFLKAFEASWLHDALPYTLPKLIRTHAFIYWIDLKLFGWNAWGWYLTALVFQLIAALVLFHTLIVLTKNRTLAFISSLIFVANTAYNDVLTWGSFNSYYPLLLIWILLTFINFANYKETNKPKYLAWSLFFAMLGFYTRETGVMVVPLLTAFDILTSDQLLKPKTWLAIAKRQVAFYILLAVFLGLRHIYGGTIGDTVDSNYKMQVRLLHDKLYRQYANVVALTFGKLIPPLLVPYPYLNAWRVSQIPKGDAAWLSVNFFPILGYIGYALLLLPALLWRKSRQFGRLFLFFWFWIGAYSLFIAALIPSVHEVLIRDYEEITARYRYFDFVAASVIYGGLLTIGYEWLQRRFKKPIIAFGLVGLIVAGVAVFNINLIHKIEAKMFTAQYAVAKKFHTTFRKEFPDLPTKAAFYIYPHAPSLNDYMFEWYLIKDEAYPQLKGESYKIESQGEAVLAKVASGKVKLNDFFFMDYGSTLINRTKDFREAILSQKALPLNLAKQNDNSYTTPNFVGPVVELPQNIEFSVSANFKPASAGVNPDSKRFRALSDYSVDRKKFLDTVKITSCRTMSQRDEEPFFFYHPDHLADGNIGRRSAWIADALPAWVAAELPAPQPVKAVTWGSLVPRIPASYSYFSSNDGTTWQLIKSIKNNTKPTGIDVFDSLVKTKFIKMQVDSTGSGDFAELDEFELITEAGAGVLPLYTERDVLLDDSRTLFRFLADSADLDYAKAHGLNFGWAKLSWGTDQSSPFGDSQNTYFSYPITGSAGKVTVKPPEAEIYAENGQLLKKHYVSVSLDFGGQPVATNIADGQMVPRYPIQP